ncbi:MAG TPA: electron transporter RnfC, partial [Eubacteriaceae bacterium]|nr:electron transporter RnfC [Eubacteriaceae bacterium]
CFKEFELGDEPDLNTFETLVSKQGKNITGTARVDFLCNETSTLKALEHAIPEESKDVFVLSCGLGIQTVARSFDRPVYAATDTIAYDAHHGMALTNTLCEACGQCYLNLTGG